jgi:hypothetical protein
VAAAPCPLRGRRRAWRAALSGPAAARRG